MQNIANRGHLKRLIAKGLIEARCKYHYTDDYGFDAAYNFGETDWSPAYLKSEIADDQQINGIIFDDSGFSGSCGRLWKNKENYSFYIHSNLSYEIRFKKEDAADFETIFKDGKIENFIHTQTKEILKVLKLNQKLAKDKFKAFNNWLKKEKKGYYSRFAKGFILTAGGEI